MISFEEALGCVLEHAIDYGDESIPMENSLGRVLAEPIVADRDSPPYDRSIRDGIAINFDAFNAHRAPLAIEGVAQAGMPQMVLGAKDSCLEVMTGAILPKNTDTVVMYEHTSTDKKSFTIKKEVVKFQNVHYQGSDTKKGEVILQVGKKIGPEEIGILASVGKALVQVKKLPKMAVVSTGNELVDVGKVPLPHQIRKSNSHTLRALLQGELIEADLLHLDDDPVTIKESLEKWAFTYDVLMLSGGVSMGKFDFLPEIFEQLGVSRIFHKVAQRPGKPFWFGRDHDRACLFFSFPGNPVSTFVCHWLYFVPWLNRGLGRKTPEFKVSLSTPISNPTELTLWVGAKIDMETGILTANTLSSSGSGDLTGLTRVDGFVRIPPQATLESGSRVPFHPTKNILQ